MRFFLKNTPCVLRFYSRIWNILFIVAFFATIIVGASAQAATVVTANDYPSSLVVSTAVNHSLIFTTPSGAAEGNTITLTFDSAFDTSTVTENDIDIEDDGINLTTAADCSGAEEASVSITSDVVTITICAGDGGAIASGSVVTVKIGSNTTSSGSGINQVINPISSGSFFIGIAGTFGDVGSIILPIVSRGTIPVSATIDQGSGGGGGGGGPAGGDNISPVISNVIVSNVTTDSALISWDTDENADGKLDYGQSAIYEIGTEIDTSLVRSRAINLDSLSEGTVYHFRVRSADNSGNEASLSDFTFTTLDETPPVISNVQVVDITETSARVTWETNELASSDLDYGLTETYGVSLEDSTLVTNHSVLILGLDHSTKYHFQIRSTDKAVNEVVDIDRNFRTLLNVAPANVSNLVVTAGDAQNDLTWSNPSDIDFAGVRVLSCLNEFPSSFSDPDCNIVYEGGAENFAHTGLINDTTYYYGVFAYDDVGQFSSGALGMGTPSAPEEEPPDEPIEPVPSCGDGFCSDIESPESCPIDCQAQVEPEFVPTPGGAECGNKICEEGESVLSCPSDCQAAAGLVSKDAIEFFAAGGTVELVPTSSGTVGMISKSRVRVQILSEVLQDEIEHVEMMLGDSVYNMSPNFAQSGDENKFGHSSFDENAYVADVVAPEVASSYPLTISIYFADNTVQKLAFTAIVKGQGYVFSIVEESSERVSGATAKLLVAENGGVWNASPFNQLNPATTGTNGDFAWYVPNGSYIVRVEANGYKMAETGTIVVGDNIVNPIVRLEYLQPPEVIPTLPIDNGSIEAVPKPIPVAGTMVEKVGQKYEEIRSIPEVQLAAQAALPILATIAVISSIALITGFGLLPFLQFLFSAPILFFWRRKRKGYGVVYNGITKTPIDLAVVRLYQLPEGAINQSVQGRLVRTRVTDKGGRYFFLVKPGKYRIVTQKIGFSFPSDYLKGKKSDGAFLDVYHGEFIEVTEKSVAITANIPMDPVASSDVSVPKQIIWKRRLRVVQHTVAVFGIIAAVAFLIIRPSVLAVAMVMTQIVIYLLVLRLVMPQKPKNWGIVYNSQTGHPLSQVVVRIFEPTYNKLLETTVTDSKGRYNFLLGPNKYFAVFSHKGFDNTVVRPIDLTANEEPIDFSQKIKLLPSR